MVSLKQILLIISFIILDITTQAQPRQEKVEAYKVAFITKHVNLTPQEAQAFWPIYNEYQDKLNALRKNRKSQLKDANQNIDNLSDKEIEQLVDEEIIIKQKELDLQKEYHAKFKSILPIKKVGKLYHAEEMFKRELLKRIQNQKGPRAR